MPVSSEAHAVHAPLRVALDARALREPPGGLRRYLQSLLPALVAQAPAWRFALHLDAPLHAGQSLPASPALRVHVHRAPRTTLLRPLWEHLRLAPALRRAPPDVFFSPYGMVPPAWGGPVLATLHDLAFLERPHLLPWQHRLYWRRLARRLSRADAVLAVSHSTRAVALERLGLDPARVHVVWSGVEARFRPADARTQADARQRFNLVTPFVLAVGAFEPRKNLGLLLAALEPSDLQASALRATLLAVVGPTPAERVGAPSHLRALGRVSDDDLVALMSAAECVAVPALDEGFGLPLVEAMACGAPVLAANAGALPEVAGGAAWLLPPDDVAAWRTALALVRSDPARAAELRAGGLTRARDFTWAESARRTLALLSATAAAGAGRRTPS